MEGYREPQPNRRQFLVGMAAATLYPEAVADGSDPPDTEVTPEVDDVEQVPVPDYEVFVDSPVFDEVIKGHVLVFSALARDQVLFVDNLGRPLKGPVTLTAAAGYTPEEMTWRYQGGAPVGIPPVWSRAEREAIAAETGLAAADIRMYHVYADLKDEDSFACHNLVEMVEKNAAKAIPTDREGRNLLELLEDEVEFPHLPEPLKFWIKDLLPGIAAEESRCTVDKTSAAGARGFLQTMPATEQDYLDKHGLSTLDPQNPLEQIPVAIMQLETSYRHLTTSLSAELSYLDQNFFGNDTAMMHKYFLAPLVINSYNAGQSRMADVVRWFVAQCVSREAVLDLSLSAEFPLGYDTFNTMVKRCEEQKAVPRFGEQAAVYFERVLGWSEALKQKANPPTTAS